MTILIFNLMQPFLRRVYMLNAPNTRTPQIPLRETPVCGMFPPRWVFIEPTSARYLSVTWRLPPHHQPTFTIQPEETGSQHPNWDSPSMVPNISLPSAKADGITRRALIYFICGNPGLIEYYTDFLTTLHNLLKPIETDTAYDIYGRNLFGFVDDEHEPFGPGNEPWDLDGQIEGIFDDVAAQRVNGEKGGLYDVVILMGHSVGAYIAVEIFHRHMLKPTRAPHLNLQYGFLLFPTLTHLALSPSGLRFEFLRRNVPMFSAAAPASASLLLKLIPLQTLAWIVERLLGFTAQAADVTARWLKSRDGVRQAIWMGETELEGIKEEQWGEELWECSNEDEGDEAKFWMFYAREDHWVAEKVREEFLARRREHAVRGGRTWVEIDEGDVPHAFCTREGEFMVVM